MPLTAADYRPRNAEHAVLYRVINEHREAFLETAKCQGDGSPLPLARGYGFTDLDGSRPDIWRYIDEVRERGLEANPDDYR